MNFCDKIYICNANIYNSTTENRDFPSISHLYCIRSCVLIRNGEHQRIIFGKEERLALKGDELVIKLINELKAIKNLEFGLNC